MRRAAPGIHGARGGKGHFPGAEGGRGKAHWIARVTVQSTTRHDQVQCCPTSHNKPLPPSLAHPSSSRPVVSALLLLPLTTTRHGLEDLRHP